METKEFWEAAEGILQISDSIGDNWIKKEYDGRPYLSKRTSDYLRLKQDPDTETPMVIFREFHVIYNESYGVPQLLFSAWRNDGSLIPLAELHDLIPSSFISSEDDETRESVWETLSQTEHPILHQPVFALHPCKTAELIAQFKLISRNWLITWLITVGPAVGLKFSHQYGINIDKKNVN